LPPDLGEFSEYRVADYFCPDEWSKDGIFISVKENEPLWIDLRQNSECACLCSIQRLNPVTGEPANLENGLSKDPQQNYMVLPQQLWLDGYANDGKVYQFTATKEGVGLAVSEYVLPKHMQDSHAMAFAFFDPKNPKPVMAPRRPIIHISTEFAPMDRLPPKQKVKSSIFDNGGNTACPDWYWNSVPMNSTSQPRSITRHAINGEIQLNTSETQSFGSVAQSFEDAPAYLSETAASEPVETIEFDQASMGAGGRIDQRIVPDNNSIDYYHEKPSAVLTIYMTLPSMFKAIIKKGRRQNANKKDEFVHSGKVGNIQVPLI
jgi:hypothetical protein